MPQLEYVLFHAAKVSEETIFTAAVRGLDLIVRIFLSFYNISNTIFLFPSTLGMFVFSRDARDFV